MRKGKKQSIIFELNPTGMFMWGCASMNHCEKHLTSVYRLLYGSVGVYGHKSSVKHIKNKSQVISVHWEECWRKWRDSFSLKYHESNKEQKQSMDTFEIAVHLKLTKTAPEGQMGV